MQNSSPNQMLMLATRIGMGSKMVITGDLKQKDRTIDQSGLIDFLNRFKRYRLDSKSNSLCYPPSNQTATSFKDMIKLVELENVDIERSPGVSKILEIYELLLIVLILIFELKH